MRASEALRVEFITRACPEAAQWNHADYARMVGEGQNGWSGRGACVLVAEDCGELLGFVAARAVAGELEVLNIGVAPENRRRGIGAALLESVFGASRAAGAKSAFCEVRQSNLAAREFYAKHGFAQTGRRFRYYSEPVEDALVLGKGLSGTDVASD